MAVQRWEVQPGQMCHKAPTRNRRRQDLMPQPDELDPDDPEDVWDHVQETIINAVKWGTLKRRNCMPRSPCGSYPNSQNSKPCNSRLKCSSGNTATQMSSSKTPPSRTQRYSWTNRNGSTPARSGLRKKSTNAGKPRAGLIGTRRPLRPEARYSQNRLPAASGS